MVSSEADSRRTGSIKSAPSIAPASSPHSRRLAGGVAVEVDLDLVALQHHFIGAQRDLAGWRFHRAGFYVEGAEMHAALDHIAFQEAVGEARRGMGALVVGDVERASIL